MGLLIVAGVLAAIAAAGLGLQALRLSDRRAEAHAARVLRQVPASPTLFDAGLVASLPDPARRYFLYAISPGAPLRVAADLEMTGEIGLGTKERPNYMPMRAHQVLRLDGFVWQVEAASRTMRISGSDGYLSGRGWTRFWLFNLVSIVRAGGDDDFARSAAGRAVAEAVFWTPAALLPSDQVRWTAVDPDTARAVVLLDGHEHQLDLTVSAEGRPLSVSLMRWSRENPERTWRLQPFGGTIAAIREIDGYRVAAEIEGGNGFGTDAYFPFYRVKVESIRLH